MPNQRGENQQLVTVQFDKRLVSAMDEEYSEHGENRSEFIRLAVIRDLKMRPRWATLPESLAFAPKRGRPVGTGSKQPYPAEPQGGYMTQEAANSGSAAQSGDPPAKPPKHPVEVHPVQVGLPKSGAKPPKVGAGGRKSGRAEPHRLSPKKHDSP